MATVKCVHNSQSPYPFSPTNQHRQTRLYNILFLYSVRVLCQYIYIRVSFYDCPAQSIESRGYSALYM